MEEKASLMIAHYELGPRPRAIGNHHPHPVITDGLSPGSAVLPSRALKATQTGNALGGGSSARGGRVTSPTLHARCPGFRAGHRCSPAAATLDFPERWVRPAEPGGPPTHRLHRTCARTLIVLPRPRTVAGPSPWDARKARVLDCARTGRGGRPHAVVAGNPRIGSHMSRATSPDFEPIDRSKRGNRACHCLVTGGAALANQRQQLWEHLCRNKAVVFTPRSARRARPAARRVEPSRWRSQWASLPAASPRSP
jgi:hypothetical protein